MSEFCQVALPVPLHTTFTYRFSPDRAPVVGGRVLVGFRQQRMLGIVTDVHEEQPDIKVRDIISVLDSSPVLDEQLMQLGRWIAEYYLAPLGEVLRTMLPLTAEFRKLVEYRISEEGQRARERAAMEAPSEPSERARDRELAEFRVLEYLSRRPGARVETLRSATGVTKAVLAGLTRKKWIVRQDQSVTRESHRVVKVAVLRAGLGDGTKLNANQRTLLETLAASRGEIPVDMLRELDLPASTLDRLVRRGLVEIVEQPAAFHISGLLARPLAFDLNAAPKRALQMIEEEIERRVFARVLLHGVTGSGKTAVYLAAMRSVLAGGRSAILLVPEIGLTPAMAADLHETFGEEVAILHSALSDAERAEQWHRIRRGEARIVVGTRSAVFAPVRDLALLIVDEEHDSSYKQEETPRYHARDVGIIRAKMANAVALLGSATPSLESYSNALQGKYVLLELPDRVRQRPLPEVEVVDMRQEFQDMGSEQVISRKLAAEINERLDRSEQVMILLNRRGYSPVVLCRACGKKLECKNCAIALTHHKQARKMQCHYCGFVAAVPRACVHCGSEYVYFLGTGSEKLEELLHGMFPQARIGRLDRDTVRGREDFERVLCALNQGELDLLVGTQMIAKGHDIHGVTLVGVVGADIALGMPDFRGAERTFQLLTQVAGRAGRGETPGKVILQTYFPDHYAVQYAARHDFRGFYEKELRFRHWMHYPPAGSLANVLVRSEKLEEALAWSGQLGKWFEHTRHEGVRVLGPAPAPILRIKGDYRYHFVLKSPSRQKLNVLLRNLLAYASAAKIPRSHLVVDVDALWFM
jgi:primosomal protein N' (replication factor Y)